VIISPQFFLGGKMYKLTSLILVILSFLFTVSCTSKQTDVKKGGVLKVTVSILPQKFIVEQIGKEKVSVNVMVPPAASPETYEPEPKKMMELKQSAIYFLIGMPFESSSFEKIKDEYKNVIFLKMQERIKLKGADGHHHHHHHHHEGDAPCDHDGDPHIWLDPAYLIILSENAASGLIKADPGNREFYVRNLTALKREIQTLHDELVDIFKDSRGKSFVVYHPAWGYFAERFGIKQVAVETEGKEPSASEMAKQIDFIKKNGVKHIFSQPSSPETVINSISSQTGTEIIMIDPLREDVIRNIKESANAIREGLVSAKHN